MSQKPVWLVTGASGFLGANIGAFLAPMADRVAVTRTGDLPVQFDSAIPGELSTASTIADRIREVRPNVVLHSAAIASHEACESDPDLAKRVNADATGVLAGAAHDIGARFVFISTDAVFNGARGHYTESDDPSPTSVYGRTKLSGEVQALQAADALVIRTNFFGWSPSGHRSILEFFVNELSAERPVRGFTDFTTTSAYTQVLAATIVDLVTLQATGIFHVTSPDALTKYEFGVTVAREFDLDPSLITPATADIHPPRTGDISLDVSKVQGVLGRHLPSQTEGVRMARADGDQLRAALRSTDSC